MTALLAGGVLHIGIENTCDFPVVVLDALQDEQRRDVKEDLSIALLKLLSELFVLFCSRFDYLRKMQKLVLLLTVHEVGQTLRPAVFELNQDFNEL